MPRKSGVCGLFLRYTCEEVSIKYNQIMHSWKALRRHGDCARLYVIDDGRGIEAGQSGRLFEPFVQGDRAGAGERGGFGLGLANVRRFARAMGGEAGIDPRWRNGAAFFIQLPLGGVEVTAA